MPVHQCDVFIVYLNVFKVTPIENDIHKNIPNFANNAINCRQILM